MPPQSPTIERARPTGDVPEDLFQILEGLGDEAPVGNIRDAIAAAHAQGYRDGYERATAPRLTEREIKVLELMSQGLASPGIASAESLGFETIKSRKASILEKLGASNGVHAVRIGIERGLVAISKREELDSAGLSPMDLAVLDRLSLGKSSREVAKELGRSSDTIIGYRRNILSRLGAGGPGAMNLAVRVAFENGILPLSPAAQERSPELEVTVTDPSGSEVAVAVSSGSPLGETAFRGAILSDR